MSITRQWMLVLVMTAVVSVAVQSILLSTLINRYYSDYTAESYSDHVSQLTEFSEQALTETNYSIEQFELHFSTHLTDSISRIRLYDASGSLLADVRSEGFLIPDMRHRGMMHNMIGSPTEEEQAIDIVSNDELVGHLVITNLSSFGNTMAGRMFTVSLVGNSLISFLVAFIFIILIGMYFSRRMSRDLKRTAEQAIDVGLGRHETIAKSNIQEIHSIQQSLEDLKTRLKVRQVSRKKLIDELVHQTRTPLTILGSHIEGLSDGVLRLTPENIKVCEAQIDNLTSMISKISRMIDAERDVEQVHVEKIELKQLLKQIVDSLKIQFTKKDIRLVMPDRGKVEIKTDKQMVTQVIYNLMTNAYKFTPAGGNVSLDYQQQEDGVLIMIEDTGSGVREEDRERIFEPYYRSSNAFDVDGEGLGLYLVKENIKQLNGSISLDSEDGKGSKFIITLPL